MKADLKELCAKHTIVSVPRKSVTPGKSPTPGRVSTRPSLLPVSTPKPPAFAPVPPVSSQKSAAVPALASNRKVPALPTKPVPKPLAAKPSTPPPRPSLAQKPKSPATPPPPEEEPSTSLAWSKEYEIKRRWYLRVKELEDTVRSYEALVMKHQRSKYNELIAKGPPTAPAPLSLPCRNYLANLEKTQNDTKEKLALLGISQSNEAVAKVDFLADFRIEETHGEAERDEEDLSLRSEFRRVYLDAMSFAKVTAAQLA